MFFSRLGCSLGVLFLLVACGQTSVPSDAPVQILRELPVVPTQAALATVLEVTPTKVTTAVAPTVVMTSLPDTAVSPNPPLPTLTPTPSPYTIIGTSAANHPLVSYQFGHGTVPLIFVGGIHGGYEWNTILLAYEMIDYFTKHPELIPENITLYIVPSANPDGQFLVTGRNGRFDPADISPDTEEILGRFNANGVDLNRNWDCEWSSTALWRDQPISGGSSPFSEPETSALRDYFIAIQPAIVLFWHSAADGVYAAGCPETHAPSYALATIYGDAADYPVFPQFDAYPVTGDASDWLTTQDIPSISIEFSSHHTLDWEQNLTGVSAILEHFGSTRSLP